MVVTSYKLKAERAKRESLFIPLKFAGLRDIPSEIFYPLKEKQRKITIKRRVPCSKKQGYRRYETSKTHVFLEPENKDEKKQLIATVFESRRIPKHRHVSIVIHEDFNLEDAESVVLQMGLLSEDYLKFKYNLS